MARNLGTLTIDMVLKLGGFAQGADRAVREAKRLEAQLKGTFTNITRGFGQLNSVLGAFGVGISAGVIVSELTEAAKAAIEFGDEIEKAMAATGAGAESLQELAFAAQQTDVDFQTLSTSVFRMQKAISEAASGSNKALIKTFDELGLNIKELQQLDAADQFEAIAGALAEFEDEADRAALGADIFGKGVQSLLPLLAQGADGVRAFREQAHELGIVLSEEQIKALAEADQALKRLSAAYDGATRSSTAFIAVPLADFLNGVTVALTDQEPVWKQLVDSADEYFKAILASRGNPILFFTELADQIRIAGTEQRELNQQTQQFGSLAETLGFPEAKPAGRTRSTVSDEDRRAIEKFGEAAKSNAQKIKEFTAEIERLAALDPKTLTPDVVRKAIEDFTKGLEKAGQKGREIVDKDLSEVALTVARIVPTATEELLRGMDEATQTAQEATLAEWATFAAQLEELVSAGVITAQQAAARGVEIRARLDVDGFRKQAEEFRNEVDKIREEFGRREQTIQARIEAGTVSEIGGRRELIELHHEEAAALEAVAGQYGEAAQANAELAEDVRETQSVIEDLKTTTDEFGKIAADAFETGLADALSDVAQGVEDLGDAADAFLNSITDSLLRWASEQVAAQMRDIIFGSLQGGFASMIGGAGGGIFGGAGAAAAVPTGGGGGLSEVAVTATRLPEAGAEAANAAAFTAAATALTTAGTTLASAGTTLLTGATTLTSGATTFVTGTTTLATAATGLLTAAGALNAAAAALAAGGASDGLSEIIITATRLAEGGKVAGPQGVDKVPAMLTAGEFVVNAQATQRPGVQQLLTHINDGGGIFKFAEGGLVLAPRFTVPKYADGGTVQPTAELMAGTLTVTLPPREQENRPPVIQHITVNAPTGQVSRSTEMQLTAAAARGVKTADRRNN